MWVIIHALSLTRECNRKPFTLGELYYLRGCPTGLEGQSVPGGHTCNIHPPPVYTETETHSQYSKNTKKNNNLIYV